MAVVHFAALLAFALTAGLGLWQHDKGNRKAEAEAALQAAAQAPAVDVHADSAGRLPEPRSLPLRVSVRGVLDADRTIFLDNRTHQGRPGFHVMSPMKIEGSDRWVAVLRGWVPLDPRERTRLPAVQTPRAVVAIDGEAVLSLDQPMMLGRDAPDRAGERLWQHFDFERWQEWLGRDRVYPLIVRQAADASVEDGLVREWNRPGVSVDRHRAYAFQWFTMSALILAGWVFWAWRSRRRIPDARSDEP